MIVRSWTPRPISSVSFVARTGGGLGYVSYVNAGAQGALASLEIGLDRIQRRVLHHHDHDGRGQHGRQEGVLELAGQVLRLDLQREHALRAEGYVFHAISFRPVDGEHCSYRSAKYSTANR